MRNNILLTTLLLLLHSTLLAQWDGRPETVDNPVITGVANHGGSQSYHYYYSVTDGAGGVITAYTYYNAEDYSFQVACQRKTTAGGVSWGGPASPVQLFSISADSVFNITITDLKPDGSGGVYISWIPRSVDDMSSVYLQHISSGGTPVFTGGVVRVNPQPGHHFDGGRICVNDAGVTLAWNDEVWSTDGFGYVSAQVMLQRYSATGLPIWNAGGVPASTAPGLKFYGNMVSDGNNGVLVSFIDSRNSNYNNSTGFDNLDIYAQHISSSGSRLWGAQDAVVTNAAYNQYNRIGDNSPELHTVMVADSAGGFMIVFDDLRNDNAGYAKLYAQRLNSNGTRVWAANGVALDEAGDGLNTLLAGVVSDGTGGLVAIWDKYNEDFTEAYVNAQRVSAAGNPAWGANGIEVSAPGIPAAFGTLAKDSAGSYITIWLDLNGHLRSQKINSAGQLQWPGGMDICTNPLSLPGTPTLTKSNGSNMISVWLDQRNSADDPAFDIYAAKFDGGGALVNTAETAYISIANGNWNDPAIWAGGMVPVAGADVIINTAVTVTTNVTCNTLAVQVPGSLTVAPGVEVTVIQ